MRHELVARFGEERVYEGGLKVFTTIDVDMQRAADAEVQRALAELDQRRRTRATADPAAAAGGARRDRSAQRRSARARSAAATSSRATTTARCRRKRQPGSAFKPFVYAAALEAGYTPAIVIDRLDDPIETLQGAWVPEDGHSTATAMTMRSGAQDVEQPRRGADAPGPRHQQGRRLRRARRHRHDAQRAVAGARLGRSHARVADHGVFGVCRAAVCAARRPTSGASRMPTATCSTRRRTSRSR